MRIHRIFMCVVGIIAFVNLLACSTTTNKVTPLAELPDKSNPGAIYILPKTAVALNIPIKITTYNRADKEFDLQLMKEAAETAYLLHNASSQTRIAEEAQKAAQGEANAAQREFEKLTAEANSSPDNKDVIQKLSESRPKWEIALNKYEHAKAYYISKKDEQMQLQIQKRQALKNQRKLKSLEKSRANACEKEIAALFREGTSSPRFETGDAQITISAVPDADHIYNMDLSTTFLKDTKKKLVFNENGMLVSADYSAKDKTLCLPAWNIDPLEGEISVEN